MKKRGLVIWTIAAAALFTSCGYNLVGRGGQFPAGVNRVAVPMFVNETKNTDLTRILTNQFIDALIGTGKAEVVSVGEAQAEVRGKITGFEIEPITFNTDRQATENRMIVTVDVSLFLTGEPEPVFQESGVSRYQEYPVPEDLALEQKEVDLAYRDVSRELSQQIISLMTEGF